MVRSIALLSLLALLSGVPAAAQTVFKCKASDGTTVYAEKPCAPDAEEIKVRAQKPPSGESPSKVFEQLAASNELAGIRRIESECIRRANERVLTPLRRRMAAINVQIANLRAAGRNVNNNLAGVTYINGLRQEISMLEQTKSNEQTAANALMAEESQRCAESQRSAEAAFNERRDAKAPESTPPAEE